MLELQLRLAGAGLLLLALLHAFFPRRFRWREGLAGLSLLDRQLFHVHTLFVAVTVAFFGVLSIVAADALAAGGTLLGVLLGGFAAFWLLRLAVQLFVFDRALWRGDRLRTALHVLATLLWAYLAALYGWAFWVVAR
jgi:hypothetical protein